MHREDIPMKGYTITFDKALSSVYYNCPPELTPAFLNQVHKRALAGEPDAEEVLSKLIAGYPHFPFSYFLLASYYLKQEAYQEAKEKIEELNQLFPEYFWSIYLKGLWCIHEKNYEDLLAILGPGLQINRTFPKKSHFHIEEFMLYQNLVGTYYLENKEWEVAEGHLAFLQEISEDHDEAINYFNRLELAKLGDRIEKTQNELADSLRYLDPDYKSPVETVRRKTPKVGRNQPCPCGSGKKYKKCCGR